MSLNSFVRTWLPLLLLAALIIFNWPSGKLDFGNTSPWAGLIYEVDVSPPKGENSSLILACLPVQDLSGQPGFFVCGAVTWEAGGSSIPILLAGRVDDLRLQQVNLMQETVDLHRNPHISFLLHDLPEGSIPVEMIGGLIQGNTLKLKPASPNVDPLLVDIGPQSALLEIKAKFDKKKQKRWRGEPARFQQLWSQQFADDPSLLAPYRHGEVSFPVSASSDGVVTEEGR